MFKSRSDESSYFVSWLSAQLEPSIIATQVECVINVLDRLDTGDLVSVLYHGKPETSSKALEILKKRFDDEVQASEWRQHGDDYEADNADSWH